MFTDANGLPVNSDGDARDQLNRVGLVMTAAHLNDKFPWADYERLYSDCCRAITGPLQPRPGIYVRSVGADANNVSADQLLPVLCAWVALGEWRQVAWLFVRMVARLGFAQNVRDGLNSTFVSGNVESMQAGGPNERLPREKWKLPDFMLLRALPLFARISPVLYPLALVSDLLLVFAALVACGPVWRDDTGLTKRGPEDVDDGVLICTLAVCRAVRPTPFSELACFLYARLRPWNYGVKPIHFDGPRVVWADDKSVGNVYGSLRWYFRAEAGGNPEVAELWKPICERYFN